MKTSDATILIMIFGLRVMSNRVYTANIAIYGPNKDILHQIF